MKKKGGGVGGRERGDREICSSHGHSTVVFLVIFLSCIVGGVVLMYTLLTSHATLFLFNHQLVLTNVQFDKRGTRHLGFQWMIMTVVDAQGNTDIFFAPFR